MSIFMRWRYSARYGSRRASAFKGVIALVVVGAALVGFTRARTAAVSLVSYVIGATATANEPRPVLSPAILQTFRSAGLGRAPATAYVVTPGASQPETLPLTPYLPNGQVDYGPTRNRVLDANISAVQNAVENEAAQGQFDLLATLAAMVRAAPAPATLIMISSGLSTSGGLDLRQVGWDASPSWLAAQLKARGLLPDLSGYQVVFSGLGNTACSPAPSSAPSADHAGELLDGDLPGQRRGILPYRRHRPGAAPLTQHHPCAHRASARGAQRDRPEAPDHYHLARHAAVLLRQLRPSPLG